MIVNDFDSISVTIPPFEADPILAVNADAEFTQSISGQFFEPRPRYGKIRKTRSGIKKRQHIFGTFLNRLEPAAWDERELFPSPCRSRCYAGISYESAA
jgi:hypothetical protein